MRHLLTMIIVVAVAVTAFMTVDWKGIDMPFSFPAIASVTSEGYGKPDRERKEPCGAGDNKTEEEDWTEGGRWCWIDTIMCAKGHYFGHKGDISDWGGWFFDTVNIGFERMLTYDSIAPSVLRLNLNIKDMTVDLGDPAALEKILGFMGPMDGFKRFERSYEECLDSVVEEERVVRRYMGKFTFTVDYADSVNENAAKINRFLCSLSNRSEIEKAKVPPLSAFYAGYGVVKHYRPVYTKGDDMSALSDFLGHKTFENWRRGGCTSLGSSEAALEIKPRVANDRYVTCSRHEYDRIGIGHGMYTETYHTLDLITGKELSNKDIFNDRWLDKVKMSLFEVMAEDRYVKSWSEEPMSPEEIEERIKWWQAPLPFLEDMEVETAKEDVEFVLPEGALTDSGVVFSFQPYEIDGWVSGTYHFIVPYEKLRPYMTSASKALAGV